jgi:hypothetical protein
MPGGRRVIAASVERPTMRLSRSSSTRVLGLTLSGTLLVAALGGCGGSLDGHDYTTPDAPPAPPSLSGTVALGAPMRDATVSVKDADGRVASVPLARDGSYRGLTLDGLTAPFSLQACGFVDGRYGCQDGVIGADGTGNVTPLAR